MPSVDAPAKLALAVDPLLEPLGQGARMQPS